MMDLFKNMNKHIEAKNKREVIPQKTASKDPIKRSKLIKNTSVDDLKKVPYAKLDVGVGVQKKLEIDNLISISGGVVASNTVEVNKGELKTSKPKAMVRVGASVDPNILPDVSYAFEGGVHLDENLMTNPTTFTSGTFDAKAEGFDAYNNDLQHSRIVKSINANAIGLTVTGEIGIDVDEFNNIKEKLRKDGNRIKLSVRRQIKKTIQNALNQSSE